MIVPRPKTDMLKHLRPVAGLSLLLIMLAACSPGAGVFASGNWQSAGLTGRQFRALTVDPNNAQNIYAGDAQDGVYMSADGGLHWQHRSAGLPSTTAVNALAFDDPGKKLYAATTSGVYVSADAGQAWTIISNLPNATFTSVAFDLKSTQAIFVGTRHQGVLTSLNGGATWKTAGTLLPANTVINNLTFDSNAHQLWAATDRGVYLSSDDSPPWQAQDNGLPGGAKISDAFPTSVYSGSANQAYAGTSQGFYLSQDGGAHWSASQTPLARVSIFAIIIDIQSASTLYIATDKAGVLRSTDSGQNWSNVATGLPGGVPVYAVTQGATNYGQLFAATNDIFLFPGTGGAFDPSRIIFLLVAVIFFYLLFRMTTGRLRRTREMLKPERIIEPSDTEHEPT